MSHPKTSHLSPQYPPHIEAVKIDEIRRRSASSPAPRDRSRRLFLHQDHLSGSRSRSSSIRSRARLVMMESWLKVKAEVPKLLYANLLVLFTWLLASLVFLPVIFATIRNSLALDGIERAAKDAFSAVQESPLLVVAGTGFICGVIGVYRHWWWNIGEYVWLTDYAFLPTLLNSIITYPTALINICAAHGRHWLVTAFVPVSVTTSTTLVAIVIYMIMYN